MCRGIHAAPKKSLLVVQMKAVLAVCEGHTGKLPSNISGQGFPGGAGAENPLASAGDMGLSPGLGRSHMLRSN